MPFTRKPNIYVTADMVVFSVVKGELKVLLIKRKNPPFRGKHALPGGFVEKDEGIDEAAARELYHETNVKDIFLKKIDVFGDLGRDPRGRTITIVYMALINSERFVLEAKTDAAYVSWVDVDSLPEMAFDHTKIINDALKELRFEIQTTNIASQLLADEFTLSELQQVYEVILDRKLDKRNFRKKIDFLDILKPLNRQRMEGAHRPAKLYSFRKSKYGVISNKIQVFF